MSGDIGKLLNVFSREDEEKLAGQKAKQFNLPYVNLVGYPFEPSALQVMPEDLAKKYEVVSYQRNNNQVRVATPSPENPALVPFLKQIATSTNLDFVPAVCSKTSYDFAIKQFEFIEPEPPTLEKLNIGQDIIGDAEGQLKGLAGIAAQIRGVSTSKMLEMIFGGAINLEASDVHIEPEEKEVRVRYRIDGVLQDVVKIPAEVFHQVANRIKYLSKMRLDTQNKAQDGRFDIAVSNKPVDVRVSAIPGAWGEVFVMRLLDQSGKNMSLEDLGFSPAIRAKIDKAIAKPHGVLLNTGPTGSGKTTTLYAMIQKLNKPQVKIVTIEDPIEYRIAGIDQTQVKKSANYTFANALKSVLRQDPDIIMVGEIRDTDTGETAMQAALTGHLVLSTLHTNSAPSSIPRLLDMGIAPFLLSGSINLIMAQRLVRKICTVCHGNGKKQETPLRQGFAGQARNKQIPNSNNQTDASLLTSNSYTSEPASSCATCNGTGYKGRIAIAEIMEITPKIEQLIQKKASVSDFERAARADGMVPMHEDGMDKVRAGITSKEEVMRVTEEESQTS